MSAFSLGLFATLDELEFQLLWPHEIWGREKSPDGGCNKLRLQGKDKLGITLSLPPRLPHSPTHSSFPQAHTSQETIRNKASKQIEPENVTSLVKGFVNE